MRKMVCLDGLWQRSVAGGPWLAQRVPYSAHICGESEVRTRFSRLEGQRVMLRFEGITYWGECLVNGVKMGEMPAYSRCEFDVTDVLQPGDNLLQVRLKDMGVAFGPSEGWENYGGIIRSVYLDVLPEAYIRDVFFHTDMAADMKTAAAHVDVQAAGEGACTARLLDRNGDMVACASGVLAEGKCSLSFALDRPRLWSPEDPYLYTLTVATAEDEFVQKVGVREFRVEGRSFMLNGQPVFLRGVCRHDLWGDVGHALTMEQIEADMQAITAAGCNFVRLVHYPHDTRVLDVADRLGLMVSEEPGLWWSDMHNQAIVDGALEVMRRTVIRDRSRACVVFWLAFNECVFTEEYLLAAAKVCRENDATRPVSGANCMDLDMTKTLFAKCGFDFYTFHPYGADENRVTFGHSMLHVMHTLDDKPLMFTEWGGFPTCGNLRLLDRILLLLSRSCRQGILAGFTYWMWADMFEFQRGEPACYDGELVEGLVDRYRNPREDYVHFARALSRWPIPEAQDYELHLTDMDGLGGEYVCADVPQAEETDFDLLLQESLPMPGYYHKKKRRLQYGPVLPEEIGALGRLPMRMKKGRPMAVRQEAGVELSACARQVYIAAAAMPWGYPVGGRMGEKAGEIRLVYADGTQDAHSLVNGENLATVMASIGPSRVDVQAAQTRKIVSWRYALNWEHYAIQMIQLPCDSARTLARVEFSYTAPGALLVYGILADGVR